MRQLLSTIGQTALRAPAMLGDILFKEMDAVSYCETCRNTVAAQRQAEQLKFAGLMLAVILIVIAVPTYLLFT